MSSYLGFLIFLLPTLEALGSSTVRFDTDDIIAAVPEPLHSLSSVSSRVVSRTILGVLKNETASFALACPEKIRVNERANIREKEGEEVVVVVLAHRLIS